MELKFRFASYYLSSMGDEHKIKEESKGKKLREKEKKRDILWSYQYWFRFFGQNESWMESDMQPLLPSPAILEELAALTHEISC